MKKLAVIDWGIGGLGFYREWKRHRSDNAIVYLSDSGFTPYGKLSSQELAHRLTHVLHFLKNEHAVTHIMIACNAASSVIDDISADSIQVQGVVEGTCQYVRAHLADKKFTLIGGTRTIESAVYATKLADLAISQKIAQPLSALVEQGNAYCCEAEYEVREIFANIDNDVVLACTHYVAMSKLIGEVFPEVRCHDPIPFIVEQMLLKWSGFQKGEDTFLTSGDMPESTRSAKLAFEVDAEFDYIDLD